ncbi:MAG TPA: hypothetical protein VK272_03975 [Solirubrobacteraceae bacterium]|nr:hypothetical protein [Solirubrobacteraceae bacterium]
MSAPALRPLRVGEILDAGINVYMRNARTLMGLTALIVVPFQALSAVLLLSTVTRASEVPHGSFSFGSTGGRDHATSLGASAIVEVTGLIVTVLVTAACVKAVSDIYLDQPTDIGSSLRFALRRVGSLVWLEILTWVALALAFVALIVPGIWLYAAWSVAVPALLIEGRRGGKALYRSFRLVRGRWWPVAGVLLVAEVMTLVVAGAIEATIAAVSLSGGSGSPVLTVVVVSLAAAVAAVLTRPFQAAVTTILYYDLRVRHEGYDVALLAEQLGIEPSGSSPSPQASAVDGEPH